MGDGEQGTRELGIYKTGNLDVRESFNPYSLFPDFSISVLQTALVEAFRPNPHVESTLIFHQSPLTCFG